MTPLRSAQPTPLVTIAAPMGVSERGRRRLFGLRRGPASDADLVTAVLDGDERAFMTLVERYHTSLVRLARMYVPSEAVAEEVAQETWLAVFKGIHRFEGRSSFRTWLFRILTNIAKTRGQREHRSIPFSSTEQAGSEGGPSVDPERFFPPDHSRAPDGWALGPTPWETPEESLLSGETREVILRAIEGLTPGQREVITLRDLEGWPADDVCNALQISETNQRVLLHRARTKVRAALEQYLGAMAPTQ
jgi:RNA polymerase sigma-70 factor (ECF subfamily)